MTRRHAISICLLFLISLLAPLTPNVPGFGLEDIKVAHSSGTIANNSYNFEIGLDGLTTDPFTEPKSFMYDVFEDQVSLYVQQTSVVDGVLFLPGIYILQAPQIGVAGSIGIGELNLVSNWSLPTNASLNCHLKTDGIHNSLACSGRYVSETLVEFGPSNFSLNGEASFIITWYNNGSLVGSWSTDEGENQICGLGGSFSYPYTNFALHNRSHYILAQSPEDPACSVLTLQDGTNLSCSPLDNSGYTDRSCYYLLRLSFNGSVIDGFYSRGESDGYPQYFAFRTPISFQVTFAGGSGQTIIRNLDGSIRQTLSMTSGIFGFHENFSFIRGQSKNLCSGGGDLYLKDLVLHPNYTFYVAYTSRSMTESLCSGHPSNSLPNEFLTWFGNDYQNLSLNSSYPVSIGFHDHVGNNDWVYSYYSAYEWMQGGNTNSILSASNNSLFMHGWTNPNGPSQNVWPRETFGKTTVGGALPNINGMLLDMNGTWLEATPSRCDMGQYVRGYAYDTWYACDSGVGNNLDRLHAVAIDSDQDGTPDFYDAFPALSSQSVDSDLDGYGDAQNGHQADGCVFVFGNSTKDIYGCVDSDGDGWSNGGDEYPFEKTQHSDSDYDGFGDNSTGFRGDQCPSTYGTSTLDWFGCADADGDGWSDGNDAFVNDASQWNDSDNDRYGDELIGYQGDSCPNTPGNSTKDRFGCLDGDGDGWSDEGDAFPNEATQYSDRDLDGYGDNQSAGAFQPDAFPGDTTQWTDADGDGHGDNPYGTLGDQFPNDPTRWQDSDNDGVADEDDAFPFDQSQTNDTDGDGYGDNTAGNRGDTFPNDPDEWDDTDGDDVGNNEDAFPFDPSQTTDADGDGFGDNPRGTGADKFPEDATQWSDIDGDGYGDNTEGTTPDAFIADPTQWSDVDGDGYGDNPTGRLADAFPNDPTQWEDLDGDGFGDNLSGNNPDPYLFDFDNDGYNDSIDPLPKLASPGDLDNDGVLDENDAFPEDYREWADADGDGEGDNADTDDDNDGWTDTDEVRQGTDPFSSSSQPIDGFEVIIPGTQVSLGAWDLIGIFGGVPVFIWIAIGFATRNGRTARYEEMLRGAQSVEDLERISGMWEYSLMMRMLGPHQGIRLERLRADLEYEFLGHRRTSTLVHKYDQTEHVEKSLPGLEQAVPHETMETQQPPLSVATTISVPTTDTAAQRADENGYEWFTTDDGTNFYRTVGSGAEWLKFEN